MPRLGPEAPLQLRIFHDTPCLMLVTDRKLAGGETALVKAVAEGVRGGVNAVQLREKDMSADELLRLTRRLRDVTAGQALLLVNGPLDVALACGADGVHLPEAVAMIERPARPFLIGRSVHSVEAAERAAEERCDHVIAGPVYETTSHVGLRAAGPRLVGEVAANVAMPVLAIGGITADRLEEVIASGASGVAVISAILASDQPAAAARKLRFSLDAAWRGRERQARIVL